MEATKSRKHRFLWIMIGIGLIAAGIAAFFLLTREMGKETVQSLTAPIIVHFPAPDVTLTDLKVHPAAFADYKGQIILYNAWATWCPPCKEEMPILNTYYQAHKQDGFIVIAVEDGENLEDVSAYTKKMGLTFPVWPDPKSAMTAAFLINSLPTSYLIDRTGFARLMWFGAITSDALEKYVTPLLKE